MNDEPSRERTVGPVDRDTERQAPADPVAPRDTGMARQPVQPVQPAQPVRERSPWTPRLIAWTVILFLLLLIALQNLATIEVRLLFWTYDVQIAWALLIAAFLGYILGWLRPRFRSRK